MAIHNPRHDFNFEGGGLLHTMGAAWFVSYAYYVYFNKEHINWQEVATYKSRASTFSSSKKYHHFFLLRICGMNEKNLDKNTLGLKGSKIKQMAKELLTHTM
jgi:hypothetical protein